MITKMNIQTGEYHEFDDGTDAAFFPVADFTDCPPRPSKHHNWDGTAWVEDIAARQASDTHASNAAVLAEIQRLESTQGRAVREAAIGVAGATQRLIDLEAQIATLRAQLV